MYVVNIFLEASNYITQKAESKQSIKFWNLKTERRKQTKFKNKESATKNEMASQGMWGELSYVKAKAKVRDENRKLKFYQV